MRPRACAEPTGTDRPLLLREERGPRGAQTSADAPELLDSGAETRDIGSLGFADPMQVFGNDANCFRDYCNVLQ